MESRLVPAMAVTSGGVLTINYTATGTTSENVTVADDGVNIVLSGNVTGSTTLPVGAVAKIAVQDNGGSNSQSLTFAGTASFKLSGGISSNGIETVNVDNAITTTGNAPISIICGSIANSAAMMTAGGSITLSGSMLSSTVWHAARQ